MLAILIMFCFNGCSKHEISEIDAITKGFKCDFQIEASELSGQMSVNDEGDLSLVFSGPDIINGLGIRVKEESVIIEVQGISERYSREESPDDSPALYIYDALCTAAELKPMLINDKITVSGKCESGDFSLTLSGTGYITEAVLTDTDTVLTFQNHVRT